MGSSSAEMLLQELGVTSAADIDVDAIARCVGVRVKQGTLSGCEARLVGFGNRALVTVRSSVHPRRRRFSIAHELGHWEHHRGRSFECRADDIGEGYASKPLVEREADAYAANLLMPHYLFEPAVLAIRNHSFDTIRSLSDQFETSLLATAIRFIDVNVTPAMLVCHGPKGRKWFRSGGVVPARWFPKHELDAGSTAMDMLYTDSKEMRPRKVGAHTWFDGQEAYRYQVTEQSIKGAKNEALTLLLFSEKEMLAEDTKRARW
jgi:hypothetical protein